MPSEISTPEIRVDIRDNSRPVELNDLLLCYKALADEYKGYLQRENGIILPDDVKFYVHEVRSGSILATFGLMAPQVLPYMQNVNEVYSTVTGFTSCLKDCYDFLLGRGDKPEHLATKNYEDLHAIVEAVAKDNSAVLAVSSGAIIQGDVSITINSAEANVAQNAAARQIFALKAKSENVLEEQLLYWTQARNDPRSRAGDFGIIDSISPSPVKVRLSPAIKASILADESNLFRYAYVVDVVVQTVRGVPTQYKVVNYHERIPLASGPGLFAE